MVAVDQGAEIDDHEVAVDDLARTRPMARLLAFSTRRPELFYPALFFFSYQIADMFNGTRALAKMLSSLFS